MDASAHPPSTGKVSRQTLSRFRNGFGFFLQWLAVCLMVFQPVTGLRAMYVPDMSGNPYWVPLSNNDPEPSSGPDMGDANENGIPDWMDAFDPSQIAWWGGGNYLVDGQWRTFPAQYHWAGVGDWDGDGIPDDLDPYPNDATNNTFMWGGGTFLINNQWVNFSGGYYAGSSIDSDGDGIPDVLDPYPNDANNGNYAYSTFYWSGGTFTINDQDTYFSPGTYAGTWNDSDGDGIPDSLDPYPKDANNGNSNTFYWAGGTYLINGVSTTFSEGTYSGVWSDRDGDGIPDCLDPYPDDSSNNTAWWQGGTFMVDGVSTTYAGQYHRADAGDADVDGIPDDLDPYPNDITNNTFWWQGGTYEINLGGSVQQITIPPQFYAGTSQDSNGDGIPDVINAQISAAYSSNGDSWKAFWWAGGTSLVRGQQVTYDGCYYFAASDTDTDGDGIPDALDEFPNDPWNGTYFTWGGGDYYIDGSLHHFEPATYGGLWSDRDGDGIPDVVDPYPDDTYNNSFWWGGGTFYVDGHYATYNAGYYAGPSDSTMHDQDMDGIPDCLDPYPNDNTNNTSYWAGGTYSIDGVTVIYPEQYYAGTMADSDGDGIPDALDPYPNDRTNNTALWPGGTYVMNGSATEVPGRLYRANSPDTDGDGIPDDIDPCPNDPNNIGVSYWAGGTFAVDGVTTFFPEQYYHDLSSQAGNGNFIDSDGDGIPDALDKYPHDATNNSFTWSGGNFPVDGVMTHFNGGTFAGKGTDSDGDGIPDVFDPYPHNPANNGFWWQGGTFSLGNNLPFGTRATITWAPGYHLGAWVDTDSDGIPDSLDPNPSSADNYNGSIMVDGLVWNGGGVEVHFPDSTMNYNNFYWAGGTYLINGVSTTFSSGTYDGMWSDRDGDGIPDVVDPYPDNPSNGDITDSSGPDYLFPIEKQRAGIALNVYATDDQYLEITGHNRSEVLGKEFSLEADWDNDGVSNYDELMVFQTDLRGGSRPSDAQIYQAILRGQCTTLTRQNFFANYPSLANGGGSGGGGGSGNSSNWNLLNTTVLPLQAVKCPTDDPLSP